MFPPSARYSADVRCARWNARYAGSLINNVSVKGYQTVGIWKQKFFAQRVIWKMMTGRDPAGEVDHINGVRTDNRWSNLRDVPRSINGKNMRLSSRNKSGATGVAYRADMGKWLAVIRCNYAQRHLGCFDTFDEALAARKKAEQESGFHPNHGRCD